MTYQNLFLCLLISALGGIFASSSNAVVVHMSRRQKRHELSNKLHKVTMMLEFIFFTGLCNLCFFLAPWFGPVSISWASYTASRLLSNMVLIGFIMGHERIDKSGQIATMVIVAGVIYLVITGPEPQGNQDIQEVVLGNPIAWIWLGILSVPYVICLFLMAVGKYRDKSPAFTEMIFFIVATCSSALSGTMSKLSSLLDGSEGPYKTILIAASWFIIVYWSYENFLEAKYVRSLARFTPQVQFGAILLNAITGCIIWEEYRVIRSWIGYVTSISLLGMGVYLLSDLDFFKAQAQDQQDFHRQTETMQDFFENIERDLSRARLERSLSRHQITIIKNSARQGLTRGASDPELGSKQMNLEPSDKIDSGGGGDTDSLATIATCPTKLLQPPSNRTQSTTLDSIDSLTRSIRNLKDLVGFDSEGRDERQTAGSDASIAQTSSVQDDQSLKSLCSSLGDGSGIDSPYSTNRTHYFLRQSSGLLELSNRSTRKKPSLFTIVCNGEESESSLNCNLFVPFKKDEGDDNIADNISCSDTLTSREEDVVDSDSASMDRNTDSATFRDKNRSDVDSVTHLKICGTLASDEDATEIDNKDHMNRISKPLAPSKDNEKVDHNTLTTINHSESTLMETGKENCAVGDNGEVVNKTESVTLESSYRDMEGQINDITHAICKCSPVGDDDDYKGIESFEHDIESQLEDIMNSIRNT